VFDGADAEAILDIDIAEGGSALGWDVVALGRRARGEAFRHGRWRARLAIRRDGRLLVDDTLDLAGGDRWLTSPLGMAGSTVYGTLFAAGQGLTAGIVDECRDAVACATPRIGVTMPRPGLLMARCLADEAETVRHAFIALWTRLRPALSGRDAKPLRLWAT
jgi:urease accessory protein